MPTQIAQTARRWRVWWMTDTAPMAVASDGSVAARVGRRLRIVATSSSVSAIVPVAVVLACAAIPLIQRSGPSAERPVAALVVSALLALPLLVRRRLPVTVFAVLVLVAFVHWALDLRSVADIALLVVVYTVASVYPARTAWAAAAVVEVGAVLAVLRWQASGYRIESLVLLTGPLIAAVCAGIAVRNRRNAILAAAEGARRRERERHQAELLAAARHRQQIAREMHDVVAHGLSVMVTLTEGALATGDRDAAATRDAMKRVADTGRAALDDMRDLVRVLRAGELPRRPQPGVGDVGTLVDEARRTGVDIELLIEGTVTDVSAPEGLTVYRIVQEALTNVRKHADATTVRVNLVYHGDAIDVEIVDDGRNSGRSAEPGFGLTGIAERAALHGGHTESGPLVGGGWRVWGRIPTRRAATGADR
ncbi:two-component sensor histidine kinase [Gordonia oryzae]|uniref:histidine kinase n=1 Tax=Gordonia oryzae TaxID=2487349 RepID=A0A3N4GY22_9ACTN|nr:histidine kinase [Gordonia oryzae]RPA65738.1 two-component sensor histidine kinase [Gordonia oryzae]